MESNNILTLDKAEIGINYYIYSLDGFDINQMNRLYDFGLVKGSKIKLLFKSIFGGTSAYLVKGSVLSLRDEDSGNITVTCRR